MCHFEGEVGRVGWEKLSLTLDPPRYALEKVTETRKKENFGKARLVHFLLAFPVIDRW